MRRYPARRKNPDLRQMGTRGWSGSLQQLSHPSAIADNELVEARNVRYKVNGVLDKREGSLRLGGDDGTKINSLNSVYNIDGEDYLIRISDDGVAQYYNFLNEVWTNIAGSPTFSDVYTNIVQAYGFVYFLNPLDAMTKWDGTSWFTFTAIANPSAAPTLGKTGTGDDNITLYYRYVWYNEVGNTLASSNASITDLPYTLDSDTYVSITVPAAPAGAVWTGIFRGTLSGEESYLDRIPSTQTVYVDKGFVEPDDTLGVPRANTTAGFHFKYADVYRDTLIGVTTELGDDTLVGSGGGDKFDSFGRSDGGFYYDWNKDSGDVITGLRAFTLSNEDGLYVFKKRRIGVFRFDEAGGAVRDINVGQGAVSHLSIHAAGNDLRAWGEDGAISVRNEPNFANIIRTKVLSIKADTIVRSVTTADIDTVSGHYFDQLSFFGLPTGGEGMGNTTCLVYDEEFAAWSEWRGITPAIFTTFVGSDNRRKLYFGDSQTGNVVEMFTGKTDSGEPIVFKIVTKQFDNDKPYEYKKFKKVIFIFGNVTGSNTVIRLLEDGVRSQLPAVVQQDTGNTGFGSDRWGEIRWGESSGEYEANTSGLIVKYADLFNRDLFSLQTTIENDGLTDELSIIGMYIIFADSRRPLPNTAKLQRSQTFI
jgi:hypothetical protein